MLSLSWLRGVDQRQATMSMCNPYVTIGWLQVLHEYIPCAPELKYSCVSYILKREWSDAKEQEIVEGMYVCMYV